LAIWVTVICAWMACTPARIASPAPSASKCTPRDTAAALLGDEVDEPVGRAADDRALQL
jgi:hypothetical protein